jgi:hypothetical protein
LRWAIDYDDIIVLLDLSQSVRNALEEQTALLPPRLRERSRRLVLELHQFEIARDKVNAVKIRRPDYLSQRSLGPYITNSPVDGIAIA